MSVYKTVEDFDSIEAKLKSLLENIFGDRVTARQDLESFYRGLLGMERNFIEIALTHVLEQSDDGSETISHPLNTPFFEGLGYLENYAPNLIKIPASKTEPATGASTCAYGNQIWNGNFGILTARLAKKHKNIIFCESKLIS